MSEKVLRVKMPDGSVWQVEVGVIADHRASFYTRMADPEWNGVYNDTFRTILLETLEDEERIRDWAAINMTWDDVREKAVMVKEPTGVDYRTGWSEGDSEVVEESEESEKVVHMDQWRRASTLS